MCSSFAFTKHQVTVFLIHQELFVLSIVVACFEKYQINFRINNIQLCIALG